MFQISERRIQQMCKNGEIDGVFRQGKKWQVPDTFVEDNAFSYICEPVKPLPVGVSNYIEASRDCYYVDKTLMIRDLLDSGTQVSLFTRPRRFGKTLNMDMIRIYFENNEEDTSIWFTDRKIWQEGEKYRSEQGTYPVIFFSFKDVKSASWSDTFDIIKNLVELEYIRHGELENSDELSSYEKEKYRQIASGKGNRSDYEMALGFLSILLHRHYNKKVIILIDEYDTPVEQGHLRGFYEDVILFMRNFFSWGLKDNEHLAFSCLTGILRIAKKSIFSGLNNLKVYSILDVAYSQYFGFTKEEVKDLLAYYGKSDCYAQVCEWYDGYIFGKTEIFNPWSVINYIDDSCTPKAFWQSTGSNHIIKEILSSATAEILENLHKLLKGETILSYIDTAVVYPDMQKRPESIYSFLLVSGYLKTTAINPETDQNYICHLSIPNKEIAMIYDREILERNNDLSFAASIQEAVFSNDIPKLQKTLEKFLLETISSFDTSNESFYHGMMIGLCALLGNRYRVISNRESGFGRFDIQLIPSIQSLPAYIIELKCAENDDTDLNMLAKKAIRQIIDKHYDVEAQTQGISDIRKIGIAFKGKHACIRSSDE